MPNLPSSSLSLPALCALGLAAVLTATAGGCSDDPADGLRRNGGGPGGSSGASGGVGGGDGGPGSGGPPAEELAFRAIEAEMQQKCGATCHTDGTYIGSPPTFLAPPDAYKSIKAQPGVVVADFYQSALLTKGAHAGPAIGTDPTFETKVIEWLKAESFVIQSLKKPSTDAVAIVNGPNDLDLTKAAVGGLAGIHLKFNASLVAGILSLEQMKIVVPAGPDVHVYKPRFYRVLAAADASGRTEIADPADSFSNSDQTVPNGAETTLSPGSALFAGDGWVPYDFGKDKIRIELEKLEPGKVAVLEQPKVCKDAAGFATNALPAIRAQNAANGTCVGCHGNGLAGLNLNSNDNALVCNQILQKINEGNIAQSIIVTKVTAGPHNGGAVADGAAWTAVITNAYNTYMKQ